MKRTGYGAGYRYVHDDPAAKKEMPCLPEQLQGHVYFDEDAVEPQPTKQEQEKGTE
jgi:putative ATPase